MSSMPKREVENFISHWSAARPSERANSQPFLLVLCDLLGVPHPDPRPTNGYFFEFPVVEQHPDGTTSNGRIDLYKRTCFVLESKQFQEAKAAASQLELAAEEARVVSRKKSSQPVRGTGAWDDAMMKARGQAERYVRAIAMTVGAAGELPGELLEVTGEEPQPDGSEIVSFKSHIGKISADLTTGADI